MELLPPSPLGHDEAGFLELLEVLHHAEARHLEAFLERAQGLAVLAEELVEQAPPGRIGEGLEHRIHAATIRDYLVTCQRGEQMTLPGARRPVSP